MNPTPTPRHAARLVLALPLLLVLAARAEVLENDGVRVTVDPAKGGAVTSMICKKATTFLFIADKGAQVAGTGSLWSPLIVASGQTNDFSSVAMKVEASKGADGEQVFKLAGAATSPGVMVTREFRLARNESGFRLRDTFTPVADLVAQVGSRSVQQAETWRKTLRSWVGNSARSFWRFTPYHAGSAEALTNSAAPLFWRAASQYGVGFSYGVPELETKASLLLETPKEDGIAIFQWLSEPVSLTAVKGFAIAQEVLLDEYGREQFRPSTGRVLALVDTRAGARTGEPALVFGSVVSATSRKVKMVVKQCGHDGNKWLPGQDIAEVSLDLEPGRAQYRRFEVTPATPGLSSVSITILGEDGAVLADAAGRTMTETSETTGENAASWKRFSEELPEVHLKGTWKEIGTQLANAKGIRKAKNPDSTGQVLALYQKQFPYYADLLAGAAEALKLDPKELVEVATAKGVEDARISSPPAPEACMAVFFNGPDGPINAYSKERSGTGRNGLGYLKVVPDKGYRFQMYTMGGWPGGYGINSEGLCTSGASINCDKESTARCLKETSGKPTAPAAMPMMLATCKDVDEAIRFIENPAAPMSFEGTLLLVDRTGSAALLDSVGIVRQIARRKAEPVFAVGNYPREGLAGNFKIGANWGWAANTMLREAFLARQVAELKGQVSLKDALWLMETHELPGGMCQHGFENPGDLYTNTSYLGLCRTGELVISHGPPCRVHSKRYNLAD